MTAAFVGGLHHAGLTVTDVAEAMSRWGHLLGLHGETTPDGLGILRCSDQDYALVLRPATGSAHLDYVCFELAHGVTLAAAAERLSACGAQFSMIELPGRGEAVTLRDPDDNVIAPHLGIPPADRRPPSRHSSRIPGWHPRKLGHVNFLTRDVTRQVQWYTDVLGFHVTDWIGTEGVWLHVNADHHVLAFLQKDLAHIHHLAFEVVDWLDACRARSPRAEPPSDCVGTRTPRHGPEPVQLLSDGRRGAVRRAVLRPGTARARPRAAAYFADDPHGSNAWGILPPRSYFEFDRASVEAEVAQLEAQQGLRG